MTLSAGTKLGPYEIAGPLELCGDGALHATWNPEKWKGDRTWIVALYGEIAIGDDKLQQESQGYVVPESFTHGSAEQRMRWFKQGFQNGTIEGCNTFN